MGALIFMVLGFIFFIFPLILTVFNIINLFKKEKIKENLIDFLIFIFGIGFTIILYFFCGFHDYNEALRIGGGELEVHAPIASWSMPTVVSILVLGVISYILIRTKKLDLPPLVIVGSMSGILICSVYMIIFIVQLSKNLIGTLGIPYLILFPINYILCSIRAELEIMKCYKEQNRTLKKYDNKFLNKCNQILNDIDTWPILSVIFAIPLLTVLICILVLLGQRPDEAIRAFLETSDWTLSTKISPPSVTYDAHYLCTVALRGHEEIVKPTRMGIRRGEKIVVNRQLCIANAFEQLIEEKTPKFHHFIRYIYDKYGYPISKHINTAWQADITYFIMKPLEWLFIVVLYLVDKNPENRIATQYIGRKIG